MSLQGSGDLHRAPPPAYQAAVQDSCYGFRLAESEKRDVAHFDDHTVPLSCSGPVAQRSYGGSAVPTYRSVAPTSRGGSVAPSSRGSSIAPMSRGGSVVPMSHGGSVVPMSRGGSVAPMSRGGSVVPMSRQGSVVPTSRRGSTIPRGDSAASFGGSVPPSSRGGSIPKSRSASIPSYSPDLSMMRQQQPISRDSSPYPGYNYNSDEQESQLPDSYYREHAQVSNPPESTPGAHQDSNVSFPFLLFCHPI